MPVDLIATVADSDIALVELQLGRSVKGVIAISRRCRFGIPQAIVSAPLRAGRPFPEVFWLTCPHLLRECGRLETQETLHSIRAVLASDPERMRELVRANAGFVRFRDVLASGLGQSLPPGVVTKGISGSADPTSVKCLHAFLAAHFGGFETPVSRIIVGRLSSLECERPCVEKSHSRIADRGGRRL